MKTYAISAAVLGLLFSAGAMAADAEAGKAKSAVCAACHNVDGNSALPIYPKIAGQHATYLENSMKAYRDGQRSGSNAEIMKPMAANLSDADIADLAAYFSQQAAK